MNDANYRFWYQMASRTKAFQIISYNGPPSPLAAKSRRFHSTSVANTPPFPLPPIPDPPYRFNAMNEVIDRPPSPATAIPPLLNSHTNSADMPNNPAPYPSSEASGLQKSLDALEAQTQSLRQALLAKNQERKATGATYGRHFKGYKTWFAADQARLAANEPGYVAIPPLPITPAKVVLFLNYEMTRPQKRKLSDGSESTSTCGHEHAKQVVSALEQYRSNHAHEYRGIPEAQVNLRSDSRIRLLESSFKASEPERIKKAHALKAVGTRADTYDDSQLTNLATTGLKTRGPTAIWRAMRDRAMLLTSTSTAFRGDSSRSLLWSDMYCCDVPINAKGRGEKIRALTLIADSSKVNTTGRVDEHGAFRHLCVELCPIGALALLFFAHFHIINSPVPNFTIDFDNPEYGQYGRREWYELFTFSTSKDCKREMQYASKWAS
ncbi:hypothetical protein C8F04DRAFT_1234451 [Mycena alexandri]|uniref:Ndc10 domain-containing protein n=1 Tax=Mycena alexandri TaxID=1745969 RepID=A0AAD6SWW0_9AGAR|nr:hypothetical protein C8F04DRAFT_1234451 [Mycena alexandri]